MLKRLVTITTLVSLLIFFPSVFMRVNALTPNTPPTKPDGRSCPTCQGYSPSNPLSKLDTLSTLGRATQINPFSPIRRSLFDGLSVHFVNTASGNLAFGLTDLYLPGLMPLAFQRTYVSDRSEDIGLGTGWSFAFADKIDVNGDKATLTDVNGTTDFRRAGRRFVLRTDQPGIHQELELVDAVTIIERAQEITRTYTKIGETYRLAQITAPGSSKIVIDHDASGKVMQVAADPGGSLTFQWAAGREPRLLAVADNAGRRVSFIKNGRNLKSAVDANGSDWTYDYLSERLRQAKDPLGRVLLQVRYDQSGHVTAVGDGIGLTHYGYNFGSSLVSQRTVVTDPLKVNTFYQQTD